MSNAFLDSITLAKDRVPRHFAVLKYGETAGLLAAGGPALVWPPGGLPDVVTVAATPVIISTSIEDAPGLTGAHRVSLNCIDENWRFRYVEVDLNGTTGVVLPFKCWRINRIRVLSAGSLNATAGTLTATIGAALVVSISPGHSSTNKASFAVGVEELGHLYGVSASIQKGIGAVAGAQASFAVFVHTGIDDPATSVATERFTFALALDGQNTIDRSIQIPATIKGPADVELRCIGVTDNGTNVSGSLRVMFEDLRE